MERPGEVMMKDPKRVKQGKRLVEYNARKRVEVEAQKSKSNSKLILSQDYGIGAIMAVGALGVFGYYIY